MGDWPWDGNSFVWAALEEDIPVSTQMERELWQMRDGKALTRSWRTTSGDWSLRWWTLPSDRWMVDSRTKGSRRQAGIFARSSRLVRAHGPATDLAPVGIAHLAVRRHFRRRNPFQPTELDARRPHQAAA